MAAETFLTSMTAIWGSRGSGKSTLARQLVKAAKPRQLVIIDPLARDGISDPLAVHTALFDGEKIVVFNGPSRDLQTDAIRAAFLASTDAHPVFILCDEAPGYLDAPTDGLKKVSYTGRHRSVGMLIIGQRPSAVDTTFRSQCVSQYWMRLADHNDRDVARKVIGPELAATLSTLPVGKYHLHPER